MTITSIFIILKHSAEIYTFTLGKVSVKVEQYITGYMQLQKHYRSIITGGPATFQMLL